MVVLTTLAMALLALYGVLVLRLVASLMHPGQKPAASAPVGGVSVVIPFRNEAGNLDAMLTSLLDQEFDAPWEIILVNDGSTDDFAPVIARHLPSRTNLSVIDQAFDPSRRLTSKQQAIERGVAVARYDLVALTDADMTFERCWLASLAGAAAGADLVFGRTTIDNGSGSLFARLQRFQLDFLFSTAYAFHRSGLPGSCMGNNLLVRKTTFAASGGFSGLTGYSIVEDRDLLAALHRRHRIIRAVEPFQATASTAPAPGLGAFLSQMTRWARGGFSMRSTLLPVGALLTAQNILFLLSIAGHAPVPVVIISYVNMLITLWFSIAGFRRIASGESNWFFPVWYLFLLFETAAFAFLFVVRPRVVWKERRV